MALECTFTETPKSASLFSSDLIVCVCGRERSESGVSLVSNRSLESQDGLFTSILKLYETKIAFFFFWPDSGYHALFYLFFKFCYIILLKKWDRNLFFFLEIYGVAFSYVKKNYKPVL